MSNNSESDRNFHFPISPQPSVPTSNTTAPNPKKKRSKFAKIEPVASSVKPVINPVSKPKRPDPGSSDPQILRSCTECGKTFWSPKALFGHMRCHPERQWRGIKPPPVHRRPVSPPVRRLTDPWVNFMSEKDYTIAACLLMLANSKNIEPVSGSSCGAREVECCAGYNNPLTDRETNLTGPDYRFECEDCKKVFGSLQALGGHRATHKNVKGCFASNKPGEISEPIENRAGTSGYHQIGEEQNQTEPVRLGVHRCSICFRVFTSGQALGGHMRCHWEKPEDPTVPAPGQPGGGRNQVGPSNESRSLDLNLPPASAMEENAFPSSDSSGLSLDLRLGF